MSQVYGGHMMVVLASRQFGLEILVWNMEFQTKSNARRFWFSFHQRTLNQVQSVSGEFQRETLSAFRPFVFIYLFIYLLHKYTPYLQYSYTTYLRYNYITFNRTLHYGETKKQSKLYKWG